MTRTGSPLRLLGACALALALLPAATADARLGDLDPSFGGGDGIALLGAGTDVRDVAVPPGGGVVAGGSSGSLTQSLLVRLSAAGAPTGLDGDGIVTWDGAPAALERIDAIALEADGSILAAGSRAANPAAFDVDPDGLLFRVSPAGDVEEITPDVLPGSVWAIADVAALSGGRIAVTGWAADSPTEPTHDLFLGLLERDGTPVTTFGINGYASSPGAEGNALAPIGTAYAVAGEVLGGTSTAATWRFTAAGAPDPGFNAGAPGIVDYTAVGAGSSRFLDLTPRGTGVLAAGTVAASGVAQAVDADGGLPASYGTSALPGATTWTGSGEGIARTSTGGALVAGRSARTVRLAWLTPAGAPDPAGGGIRTFATATLGTSPLSVALGAGDAATVGGDTPGGQGFVARFTPNAPPAAALTAPAELRTGAPAEIDAQGSSDPEGEPLRYAFDLDGNGSYEFDGGENPLALRSFATPGTYAVGVRVTDPRGGAATARRQIAVAAGAPVPQPVLGKQGVARPVSGTVRFRLPGQKKFRTMTDFTAIPNGTEIDARKGKVLLTVLHDASGRLDGARFYAGRFVFSQGKGAVPLTTLRLTNGTLSKCRKRKGAGASVLAVAAKIPRSSGNRRLWGNGRGRFRTRGRYGAATVRGTKWLTDDRCDGTLVRVKRGKVAVKDLQRPRKRAKLVKAGQELFVKKRGA